MLDRLHMELLALLPSDLATAMQSNLSPYSRRRLSSQHSSHSLVTSIFGGMLQSEVRHIAEHFTEHDINQFSQPLSCR